jgi:Domain of unknown function (DUF4145)
MLTWIGHPNTRGWMNAQSTALANLFDSIGEVLTVRKGDRPVEKWRIGRCENCLEPMFVIVDEAETAVMRTFPAISLQRPEHIPPAVADDFVEGQLTLSVGAFKSAVTTFRRSLQAAALEQGSDPKLKLVKQLDELGEKGALNQSLLKVAHQVRHFGNYGAHPDEDGLGDVTEDEARAVGELTWQVLEDLYVNPAKLKRMGKALDTKLGKAGPESSPIEP